MRGKGKLLRRIVAMSLAIVLLSQTMLAHGAALTSETQTKQQVLEYLTEIYGEEEAQIVYDNLVALNLIDENGGLKSFEVELDGRKLTAEELSELVLDETTDLSKTCTIDGQEVTLEDVKKILEIEEELARIQETYFNNNVKLTSAHEEAMASIQAQFLAEGIGVAADPESEDAAAMEAGYKSQLARISVDSTDKEVEQGSSVTYTFTLSKALDYEVSFDYKVLDGAAVAGTHFTMPYSGSNGTVTFAAGKTTASITIKTSTLDNQKGKSNVSAATYATNRWQGDRPFFIQCYNPKNVLFADDKTSLSMTARIQGNYTYTNEFTRQQLGYFKTGSTGISDFGGWGTDVIPIPNWERKLVVNNASFGVTIGFVKTIDGVSQDLREYIKEGMVDKLIFTAGQGYGNSTDTFAYLYIPGTVSSSNRKVTSSEGGDYSYIGMEDNDFYYRATIIYEIRNNSTNKNLMLNNTSLAVGGESKKEAGTENPYSWIWTEVGTRGFFIDETKTTVTGITAPAGTYNAGDIIPITVTFSEPVYANEATMAMKSRSNAVVVSDSNTCSRQHTFLYTVTNSDAGSLTVSSVKGAKEVSQQSWNGVTDYTTETVLSGVTMNPDRYKAVQSVSIDKSSYPAASANGTVTVTLDTTYSKWLEQSDPEGRALKASIDGGNTLIDLTMSGDGKQMSGTFPLELNVSGQTKPMRLELYLNTQDDEETSHYYCMLGDGLYKDFAVNSVIFAKKSEMQITYPDKWPSDEDYAVFLTSKKSTKLSYTYSGSATYQTEDDFVWSSSDESVATIQPDGTIVPVGPGEVTFRLTAINGNKDSSQNVYLDSETITVNPGGDPELVIPDGLNKLSVTRGDDAVLRWTTNIIYKNQSKKPAEDTEFTVKLYKGNYTQDQLEAETPIKTYTSDSTNNLTNVTAFSIPAEDIDEISVNDVPGYTVSVSVKHPLNETVLTAVAYIVVYSPAAVVTMDKPSNIYLLDSIGETPVTWLLENFDSLNQGEFEFKVSRNDATVDESIITFDAATQTFTKGMTGEDGTYHGSYQIPVTAVDADKLYDIYTVNIKAKNRNESTWSYDSTVFYVYNHNALDILVNGEKTNDVVLSNTEKISQMSSSEILALNRDITLMKTISINYGDYAWAQVTDKIKWLSGDSSIASLNYQEGGIYDNIENYSYITYRPSEQFVLSGLSDGTTTIKATHARTGMESKVNVQVETLTNKLYLFQATPKQKTELSYTNGNGEECTATTDENGALALYEESGINGDVKLKAVDGEQKLYLATIPGSALVSGEQDGTRSGLYPINNVRLREPAHVVFYLKNLDGTPYTGGVTYRGGVYKNGEYCEAAQLGDKENGIYVTPGADGKLDIRMDPTQFYTEEEGYGTEILSKDTLKFVFEVIPDDGADDGTLYKPMLLEQQGNVTKEDLVATSELTVSLEERQADEDVFIVKQVYADIEGSTTASETDVRKFTKKIGPSVDFPEGQLRTTIFWLDKTEEEVKNATVQLKDEFGAVPKGQSYKNTTYPFSTIMVTEHTQLLNSDTLWMKQGNSRSVQFAVNTNENSLYKTIQMPFRIINMMEAVSPAAKDSGTMSITAILKNAMTVDGASMSTGDAFIGLGMSALEAISMDTPVFTMNISATKDPTVYNVWIQAGYSNIDKSLNLNTTRDEQVKKTPGVKDAYKILKGTYMEDQQKTLKENAKAASNKDKDIYFSLKGYYEGQVVYDYEKGKWKTVVKAGGFEAGGGLGYHWNFNGSVGPVPVTAELGLGAAVLVNFDAKAIYEEQTDTDGEILAWSEKYKDDEYVTDYLTTLRICAYINAFGGLGFDYSVVALKIGVFGSVNVDNENTWLSREYLENKSDRTLDGQSLTLTGRTGVSFFAKFLFFSYKKVLASASYSKTWVWNHWDDIYEYWEKTTGGPLTADYLNQAVTAYIENNPDIVELSDTAVLESRAYLDIYDRSWDEGSPAQLFSFTDEATGWEEDTESVRTVLTNAYPYANPELTEDGMLLAYLSDSDSTDVEKTVASWGWYNGGGYCDGGSIEGVSLGYGDSGLRIAGTVDFAAATWVQQKTGLNKDAGDEVTSSEQMMLANSSEIMVSVFDSEEMEWTSKRLTDNGNPDLAPVIAANDSKVFVAWRSVRIADEENVTDFGLSDQILYCTYDKATGIWSETKTLYNGTNGSVEGLQATMLDNGTAAVVYTLNCGNENNTSGYEIVCAVVDADGAVVTNQKLTCDEELDENPQITTADLDGEQFVIGWHHVSYEEETEKSVSDIYFATMDADGYLTTAKTGMADSLRSATGGAEVSVDANFKFAKSEYKDLSYLSILWASNETEADEDKPEEAKMAGSIKGMSFFKENGKIILGAVQEVAKLEEGAQIDDFTAYMTNEKEVRLMLLSSIDTGVTQEETYTNPETDEEETIAIPVTRTDMQMAQNSYTDKMEVSMIYTDLSEMMKGLNLPIRFSVSNKGTTFIKKVILTVGGTERTFEDVNLMPNATGDFTIDYPVPEEKIKNVNYKVKVVFLNDKTDSEEEVLYLATPDTGISNIETIEESDGQRTFRISLYNDTDVDLEGSGYTVKLGFFEDAEYETALPGLDTLVLDSDTDLGLIDAGAYRKQLTFDIKSYIENKGYTEVPEAGIPIYFKVWIEDADGKELIENNSVNNTQIEQYYSLQKDKENTVIESNVELKNNDGAMKADVTMQNLKMAQTGSRNAVVSLLGETGEVLESKYLAANAGELLTFGAEETIVRSVQFSQVGSQAVVNVYECSGDEMDANLSDLTVIGAEMTFAKDTLSYEVELENEANAQITALAASQDAKVSVYDTNNKLIATGQGAAAVSTPIVFTSVNGESNGNENSFKVVVNPSGAGAEAKSYTVKVSNNQKSTGSITLYVPDKDISRWFNKEDTGDTLVLSAEELIGFSTEKLEYSLDGGTTWKSVTGDKFTKELEELLPEDGVYTVMARAVDSGNAKVSATPITLKVDRTTPEFTGTMQFAKTELNLESMESQLTRLRMFGSSTNPVRVVTPLEKIGFTSNKQVKVTVQVADAESKLARVYASTEDGDTYELSMDATGSYSGIISKEYEGKVSVTAVDNAGNSSRLMSDGVIIRSSVPTPETGISSKDVTKDSAAIEASATYSKDSYFKNASISIREKNTNEWTTLEETTDAEEAADMTADAKNLKVATPYEARIRTENVVDDVVEEKIITFYTAADTPAKPELTDKTSYQITLKEVTGAEYRYRVNSEEEAENWSAWTTNPVFAGLSPATEYVFEQRIAATQTVPASAASSDSFKTYPLYQVTFDGNTTDEVTQKPEKQNIAYNERAEKPGSEPKRTGYTFTGWYSDKECKVKYDFTTKRTEDINLYAGWKANEIAEGDYTVEGLKGTDGWYVSDVVIKPAGDYTRIWDTETESWEESLTIREGKETTVNFKLRKILESGEAVETLMLKQPLSISIDTTDPTGTITAGSRGWSAFHTDVADNCRYTDSVEVTVETADNLSGVAKTEYLKSDKVLTLTELAEAEGWQSGDSLSLDLLEEGIIYFRITDKAGLIGYVNSDRLSVPQYSVTYEGNTEEEVQDLPNEDKISYNCTVTEPDKEPRRTGYLFTGWYPEENCEEAFDFEIPLTGDIILYAGWKLNEVEKGDYTIQGTKGEDGWYISDVIIKPAGVYTHIWNAETMSWEKSLTIKKDKAANISFKLGKLLENGDMAETQMIQEALELHVDTEKPTGSITVGEKKYSELVSELTDGILFSDTVKVEISGKDALSGIESIRYLVSDKLLSEKELEKSDKWVNGKEVTLNPDGTYVVYTVITDKAGNSTYISTDKITVERPKPVEESKQADVPKTGELSGTQRAIGTGVFLLCLSASAVIATYWRKKSRKNL